jgi:tellurite resistance protein TerC
MSLFPIADYWWFYAGFTFLILLLLAVDLGVFQRKAHAVPVKEALTWTLVWATLAMLFCYGLYSYAHWKFGPHVAQKTALEFLAGYVVEQTLSLDNMFVFVLVFAYFGIPARLQHKVLFYGILGALIFRATFIVLGSSLLQYAWVLVAFGVVLIASGLKMMFAADRPANIEGNLLLRTLRKIIPVSSGLEGHRFFSRHGHSWRATPLFLTLAFVEVSDIVFAVDSVPAIFAITREPLVVFTSNVFAILGLRSMYFLLASAVARFHLLRYGVSVILIFVGLKVSWLNGMWDGHFPIAISLAVIGGVLACTIALSLLFPRVEKTVVPGTRPAGSAP